MAKSDDRKPSWVWLERSPTGGADGSAYAKLFRNDLLSPARLLAREVLQNSWDAALKVDSGTAIPFRFNFRFVSYSGDRKSTLLQEIGLEELVRQRKLLRGDQDIPDVTYLSMLIDPDVPLRVLYLEDFGTTGMDGDPENDPESRLYKALYLIGGTLVPEHGTTRGGSFGFGKSAFISASRLRTVLVHTRFAATQSDPVAERLLGFTWWGAHEVGGVRYEGRAMFGRRCDTPPVRGFPLVGGPASELAERIGMPSRDGSLERQGSTIMLIDPVVEPQDIVAAVEDYWWPALEGDHFDVTVFTEDGEEHYPRPRLRKDLAPFLKAYGIAARLAEPNQSKGERRPSDKWRAVRSSGGIQVGELALVLDPTSARLDVSDGDGTVGDDADLEESPLFNQRQAAIALVRGPRMVIEYRSYATRLPIRGVFIASDELDPHLRSVEPPSHNTWATAPSSDSDEISRNHAKSLLSRIQTAVRAFAKEHSPPPERGPVYLKRLERLLGPLFRSPAVPTQPSSTNAPKILLTTTSPDQRIRVGGGLMQFKRSMSVEIPNFSDWTQVQVGLEFETYIAESGDSRIALEPVDFEIEPPTGCELNQASSGFIGEFEPGETILFGLTTDAYREDLSIFIRYQVHVQRGLQGHE